MKQRQSADIVTAAIIFASLAIVTVAAVRYRRTLRPNSVTEIEMPEVVLSPQLGQFLAVLNTVENEDDHRYRAGLEALRCDADSIIAEAGRLLISDGQGGNNFALRHSVVLAVAAMRDPGALGILAKVALNPQPLPPALSDMHDAEDIIEATIVALDAIDGIEALATAGHAAAVDVRVAAAATGSNAVRALALTALGADPAWAKQHEKAVASLPADLQHLGKLQRKPVADVPQILDPRDTLIDVDRGSIAAPPLAGDTMTKPYTVKAGTPRAKGR